MKRRDEVTVGILLTVAVVVLITGTLWLVRGGLQSGYPLHTRFPWGHSIKQGQAVVLAGVTVGYVSDVRLDPDGLLDVDLAIYRKYQVPKTALAEVQPVGIFGDVIVAMRTTTASRDVFAPGDTVPIAPSAGGSLEALQARADTIATALGRITQTLEAELLGAGAIRDLRRSISGMNTLVASLNESVAEQNRNMTATLAAVRSAVDSAEIARTLGVVRVATANADTLMQRLSSNTTQLQAILARLERGEGTAGKLLADTALYRDARVLMARADSLLTDFQKNPRKYINLSIF